MTTVALDGRGAERGAEVIVAGARAAAADGIARARLRRPGRARGARRRRRRSSWSRRPGEITNDDEPVRRGARTRRRVDRARRRRRRRGRSEALVSAGPTGATMTAALFALRRIAGRAAPGARGPAAGPRARAARRRCCSTSGANAEARAGDLVQFAYLGSAFSRGGARASSGRGSRCSRSARRRRRATPDVVEAHAELAAAERDRLPRQHRGPRPARPAPPTWSSPTASPATSR